MLISYAYTSRITQMIICLLSNFCIIISIIEALVWLHLLLAMVVGVDLLYVVILRGSLHNNKKPYIFIKLINNAASLHVPEKSSIRQINNKRNSNFGIKWQ